MVDVDLSVGTHTIKMSLNGYDELIATINVDSAGAVTCIPNANINCNSHTPPGLIINTLSIIGYLKSSTGPAELCQWITNKGGPAGIVSFDIMLLVQDYIGAQDLGFNVTSADIMGAIAYYLGNNSSGNSLTGCNF